MWAAQYLSEASNITRRIHCTHISCNFIAPYIPLINFTGNLCEFAMCLFSGYDDERTLLMSQKSLEKRFGQSPVFIAATFMEQGGIPPSTNPATLLKEAIHVISCGYEDKTEWGKEVSMSIYHFALHSCPLILRKYEIQH